MKLCVRIETFFCGRGPIDRSDPYETPQESDIERDKKYK